MIGFAHRGGMAELFADRQRVSQLLGVGVAEVPA